METKIKHKTRQDNTRHGTLALVCISMECFVLSQNFSFTKNTGVTASGMWPSLEAFPSVRTLHQDLQLQYGLRPPVHFEALMSYVGHIHTMVVQCRCLKSISWSYRDLAKSLSLSIVSGLLIGAVYVKSYVVCIIISLVRPCKMQH